MSISTDAASRRAVLQVANSGPVIPADRVDALVEPFGTLAGRRARGEGHGLGLTLIAAIVEAHDGALTVRPNPDGGMRVTVEFGFSPP